MITKEIAVKLTHGTILHHKTLKNNDQTPMRCRISGKCITWKTRPEEFSIPAKYGMYASFRIDNFYEINNNNWELP